MSVDPALIAAGSLTGFIVGLTGVGGGALMTPILLLIFGIAPQAAVGTDLWFAAITKLSATRIHHKRDLIDWVVVKRLWWGSLSFSALTLLWIKFYPLSNDAGSMIKKAVAIAVLVTAFAMVFQKKLQQLGRTLRIAEGDRFKSAQAPLTFFAGAVLGVLVTATSVGAGALGAVFLAYLYPLRLTPPRLVATDLVHAIPLAVFAGIGHLIIGNVEFGLLGQLLIGSIPAVIGGALLSTRLPHTALRIILAVVLSIIGVKLALSV